MVRPDIEDVSDAETLQSCYWLKAELVALARLQGVSVSGNKAEIRTRLQTYFETGTAPAKPAEKRVKPNSTVWSKAELNETTIITRDISFGPNVRGFFKRAIGKRFSCTSEFMAWVKANSGKTLKDAIDHWHALEARKQDPSFKRDIAPDNQFNRYIRAFFEDNPDADMAKARTCWLAKSRRPGKPVYDAADLDLT